MNSYDKIRKSKSPKTVSKRMGLYYLGERFQMNHKKTLNDSHCITRKDEEWQCMSISKWIERDLLSIWYECFSKGGSKRLQLCSDALKAIRIKMEEQYPVIYTAHIERRKKKVERRRHI
jgi:hypothetical protein